MSLHLRYISFLWQVADLGCNLNMPLLRDGARVLMKLMPPGLFQVEQYSVKKKSARRCPRGLTRSSPPPSDNTTVENLRAVCLDHAKLGENSLSPSLDSRFFGPSPSQVLYLIEVGGSQVYKESLHCCCIWCLAIICCHCGINGLNLLLCFCCLTF